MYAAKIAAKCSKRMIWNCFEASRRMRKRLRCVEGDGKPRLLDFGVTNEQAWEVGLACGGKVQVFVEKLG